MSYNSAGAAQFALTYELSPIFFIGDIAGNLPGAAVPIISLISAGMKRQPCCACRI